MSDIALILNMLLGALLIGALTLGWRLESRLKALRASHETFAAAIGDLDRAATRAEQGLAELRAATDEASETLAGRIERAKALAGKLERLTAEAEAAEAKLAAAPRPAPARETAFARFSERYAVKPAAPARTDLILEDEPAKPEVVTRLERLKSLDRSLLAARSRARVDDELFETPEPRRAAGGAR